MRRVLVLGDELQSRNFLKISLERNGYDVHAATTSDEGLRSLRMFGPDIVLLELKPRDPEGSRILADLKSKSSIPVLVLSVAGFESDAAALLNAGADDYMAIPFDVEELLARMNVALRRTLPAFKDQVIACGNLTVDLGSRSVSMEDREVDLTSAEFEILAYLVRNRGEGVTLAKMLAELWGPLAAEAHGSLHDHIASLRRKIEADSLRPDFLLSEPGIGYLFSCSP